MQQEEILTLQFGAFSNSIMNDYWDLEQLNAEEAMKVNPEARHNSIFINNDPKRPRTIIFDLKDNLEKYSFFQSKAQNVDKENLGYWDQNKVQVFDFSQNQEEEEKGEVHKKKIPWFSKFTLTEKNFCRVPPVDNFFNIYHHGSRMLQSADQLEEMENKVRYFLEDSDYLRGFQCFLDTNSGFGSINKYILEYLSEECSKSPIFQYALNNEHYTNNFDGKQNEKILEGMKFINGAICMQELKEYVSCYIPIDVENLLQTRNLHPGLLSMAPKKSYNILSLILSNLSIPYRYTGTGPTAESAKGFIDHLLPYPELNIFNAYSHIQGYPQYFDKANGPAEEEKLKSIFNYKEFKPLSLFTVNGNKDKLKKYTTFAEEFVLRGGIQGIKIPKEFESISNNFHIQESGVLLHDNLYRLFDPKIVGTFESLCEGPNSPEYFRFPVHSVLYSSEITKFYMEDMYKGLKTVERGARLQFIKEGLADDEFKEIEHFYQNMRDSYDNARDDVGGDDAEEDDDF
jgi:hypothetical protein